MLITNFRKKTSGYKKALTESKKTKVNELRHFKINPVLKVD